MVFGWIFFDVLQFSQKLRRSQNTMINQDFFQNYIDNFNRFHSRKSFEYDKNLTVRNHPKIKNFDNVSGI